MSRIQLPPLQGTDGRTMGALERYVLEPNGPLDRAPDLSGLTGAARQTAIDDFIAAEDLVGYYDDESAGSVSTSYPLLTDAEGRCPDAWFYTGTYDHYVPADIRNPLERWNGVAFDGVELGSAEITSSFTRTGAGNSDVTGLSKAVTVGDRPIELEVNAAAVSNSSSGGITYVRIMEGTTVVATMIVSLTVISMGVGRKVRITPDAGIHTYKVNLQQVLGGNSTLFADAPGAAAQYGPAQLTINEV